MSFLVFILPGIFVQIILLGVFSLILKALKKNSMKRRYKLFYFSLASVGAMYALFRYQVSSFAPLDGGVSIVLGFGSLILMYLNMFIGAIALAFVIADQVSNAYYKRKTLHQR